MLSFDNSPLLPKFVLGNPLIQPAIICSKLTMETLKQGVKYVQS